MAVSSCEAACATFGVIPVKTCRELPRIRQTETASWDFDTTLKIQ